MSGIGDVLTRFAAALPSADIVLVNPLVGLSTADVFASAGFATVLRDAQNPPARICGFGGALIDFWRQGNDLQPPRKPCNR